jgi:Protein of unknown function (DUF1566)
MTPLDGSRHAGQHRPMNNTTRTRLGFVIAATLLAAGCGGGGGGGSSPQGPITVVAQPALAGSVLTWRVTFPAGTTASVDVSYRTADIAAGLGAATGGAACGGAVDYAAVTAGQVASGGAASVTISVNTCANAAFEPNERMELLIDWQGATTRHANTIVNNAAGGLNDTGVTQCLDAAGALVACTAAGALAGQDGAAGRDAQVLTNGGTDGRVGFSYAVSGECVRDNVTGLTWSAAPEAAATLADAQAAATAANTAARCGGNDWRLPTTAELLSLVDNGLTSGARIDPTFAATPAAPSWTSEAYAGDARASWVVDFGSGAVSFETATTPQASRLVRGTASTLACDAAAPHFTVGTGTVTDSRNGLMWQQCADGLSGADCASGSATSHATYAAALARAAAVNADAAGAGRGFNDWRVPNRNELASLVNRSCEAPAIQRTPFPGTPSASFWSSSPALAGFVWYVDFTDGSIGPGGTSGNRVLRLVRGGQ